MKRPRWFQKGLMKLAGVSESYTPEQLAEAGKTWNWNANYQQEQKAQDIIAARQLWQSNGYGTEAVNLLSNSIIGKTGIIVQWPNDRIQEQWDNHRWSAQHPEESFKEEQRRVMQNVSIDGESFVHYIHSDEGLFNEHIDPLMIPHGDGKDLGITRDRLGRPVSYKVRNANNQIEEVSSSQICHTYWSNFTSTKRGMSRLRGAIEPLNALRDVTRDYRQAVRIIMAFRALVKYDQNAPDIPKRRMADGRLVVDLERLSRMLQIAPDRMPLVPAGLEFIQPEQSTIEASLFLSLKKALLSEAARSIGVSYFSLASDLEGANFSSLRQGAIEDKDLFYWLLSMLLTFVMRSVKEWMLYMSLEKEMDTTLLLRSTPQFFMPSFEFIDPAKQSVAMKNLHGIHGISLTEIIRMENRNPDETFRLIAEDKKKLEEYAVRYGVDIGGNGQPAPQEEEPEEEDDSDNDDNANPSSPNR